MCSVICSKLLIYTCLCCVLFLCCARLCARVLCAYYVNNTTYSCKDLLPLNLCMCVCSLAHHVLSQHSILQRSDMVVSVCRRDARHERRCSCAYVQYITSNALVCVCFECVCVHFVAVAPPSARTRARALEMSTFPHHHHHVVFCVLVTARL